MVSFRSDSSHSIRPTGLPFPKCAAEKSWPCCCLRCKPCIPMCDVVRIEGIHSMLKGSDGIKRDSRHTHPLSNGHNNPFSKAACPQVEHFYAFFSELNSYQTNADVPLFQLIFLKSVSLRPENLYRQYASCSVYSSSCTTNVSYWHRLCKNSYFLLFQWFTRMYC